MTTETTLTRERREEIILRREGLAAAEKGGRGFWQSHDFILACRASDEIDRILRERNAL